MPCSASNCAQGDKANENQNRGAESKTNEDRGERGQGGNRKVGGGEDDGVGRAQSRLLRHPYYFMFIYLFIYFSDRLTDVYLSADRPPESDD